MKKISIKILKIMLIVIVSVCVFSVFFKVEAVNEDLQQINSGEEMNLIQEDELEESGQVKKRMSFKNIIDYFIPVIDSFFASILPMIVNAFKIF
ncbi:MAG: hypothetical protein IJN50_06905 [Clostridia bacterium]|nr:hypothetical protein [Clostridia bacterium]